MAVKLIALFTGKEEQLNKQNPHLENKALSMCLSITLWGLQLILSSTLKEISNWIKQCCSSSLHPSWLWCTGGKVVTGFWGSTRQSTALVFPCSDSNLDHAINTGFKACICLSSTAVFESHYYMLSPSPLACSLKHYRPEWQTNGILLFQAISVWTWKTFYKIKWNIYFILFYIYF